MKDSHGRGLDKTIEMRVKDTPEEIDVAMTVKNYNQGEGRKKKGSPFYYKVAKEWGERGPG